MPFISFSQDGTLDSNFGINGQVITDIGNDYPNGLALQDKKLIAAGDNQKDIVIIRYLQNGKIDSSFGENGFRVSKDKINLKL